VRSFLTEFEWMGEESGEITGSVNVLYYLDKPGLIEDVVEIQHSFRNAIASSLHVHLEENKCLEIIAVRGSAKDVKGLAQALIARKGVKQVKVAAMAL
jgi:CopG family nickel-responsive transcriptional regulator